MQPTRSSLRQVMAATLAVSPAHLFEVSRHLVSVGVLPKITGQQSGATVNDAVAYLLGVVSTQGRAADKAPSAVKAWCDLRATSVTNQRGVPPSVRLLLAQNLPLDLGLEMLFQFAPTYQFLKSFSSGDVDERGARVLTLDGSALRLEIDFELSPRRAVLVIANSKGDLVAESVFTHPGRPPFPGVVRSAVVKITVDLKAFVLAGAVLIDGDLDICDGPRLTATQRAMVMP